MDLYGRCDQINHRFVDLCLQWMRMHPCLEIYPPSGVTSARGPLTPSWTTLKPSLHLLMRYREIRDCRSRAVAVLGHVSTEL